MRRSPAFSVEPHAPHSTASSARICPRTHTTPGSHPAFLRELLFAAPLRLSHRLGSGLSPLAPRWSLRPLRPSSPPAALVAFSLLRYHPPGIDSAGVTPSRRQQSSTAHDPCRRRQRLGSRLDISSGESKSHKGPRSGFATGGPKSGWAPRALRTRLARAPIRFRRDRRRRMIMIL
jgi:hypothetical protein